MNNQPQTSRDWEFYNMYQRYKLVSPWNNTWTTVTDNLVISGDCSVLDIPNKKEETPMKKHFTFAGSGQKFDTRADAEKAAKKWMDSANRNYGQTGDIAIYEAVACITFPIPSYEVVDLAAAAAS